MAWLARLDARAARWPQPRRGLYLALKWTLVALGAYILIGMGVQQARSGQVGLGLAFLVFLAYTAVWWLIYHRHLLRRHRRP